MTFFTLYSHTTLVNTLTPGYSVVTPFPSSHRDVQVKKDPWIDQIMPSLLSAEIQSFKFITK
jgi:hypothetical protein